MKKGLVFALAALLVAAFSMPAAALDVENIFGGYFDVRPTVQGNFLGERFERQSDRTNNTIRGDAAFVDSRTRIYYFARFSDNFRLVNRWEMDAVWGNDTNNNGPGLGGGSKGSHGAIGADSINVETKNTFAEFTFDPFQVRVGTQGGVLNRSFLFDGDYSGIHGKYEGEVVGVEASWIKQFEGGNDNNSRDQDQYNLRIPITFGANKNISIVPGGTLIWSNNGQNVDDNLPFVDPFDALKQVGVTDEGIGEINLYYLTLDADLDFESFDLWFTGIYQGGELKDAIVAELTDPDFVQEKNIDVQAFLVAGGGGFNIGPVELHAEGFYASGQDKQGAGEDIKQFSAPNGQSYYWSEIMGLGILGDRSAGNVTCAGSPGDFISNIWALNFGGSMKPVEKMKIAVDLWYAQLVEDRVFFASDDPDFDPDVDDDFIVSKEDKLGIEINGVITYELMENVKIDFVGAYLFADDAISVTGKNDDDPYELGTKLSLSF